jgi:hypothetical protein
VGSSGGDKVSGIKLGKISQISFGYGGYQDVQFGVSFLFQGDGWGCGDFWGHWGTDRTDFTQWTEESRIKHLGETCMKIRDILSHAKVSTLDELKNVPVEVTFVDNCISSWRILKEVL